MECDICYREHDAQKLPFLCAVDARNRVYEHRMAHLQSLMQNESLQQEITQHIKFSQTNGHTIKSTDAAVGDVVSKTALAEDRTDQILAKADALRNEIKAARDDIRARKAALSRRRSDLVSLSEGLDERREKQLMEVQKTVQTINWRWKQTAEEFAEVRSFLCAETASLYGLRATPANDGSQSLQYHIGQMPITDLTNMNSVSPEVLSTSLAHISHMLLVVCNYLAIRLPAEIVIPHRDYPRPTIFNLSGSYNHHNMPFSNTAGIATSASETRLADSQQGPRPRPLFVDKPLPQLSKEDPVTYSFFLEGVTLLAYNVAWLCGSQGVTFGEKGSFEDVCHIGRNLHTLLLARDPSAVNGSKDVSARQQMTHAFQSPVTDITRFGRFSHGTAYDLMGGTPGIDPAKALKLQSPIKLADQLKKKLGGDPPAGDWEVIDDDIPKMDGDMDAIIIDKKKDSSDKAAQGAAKSSPRTGSNGWMRVKNR